MPAMVNSLISECAWGRVNNRQWEPVNDTLGYKPPAPGSITFGDWLEKDVHPLVADRLKNEDIRRLRKQIKTSFTEPGFGGFHKQLVEALTLPPSEAKAFAELKASSDDRTMPAGLARGFRFLLPSFFELLLHLQRSKREFAIVLRTFGIDIADVAAEMNLFATGRHPSYPGVVMDGREGSPDLRLSLPSSTAAMFRSDDRLAIVFGTTDPAAAAGASLAGAEVVSGPSPGAFPFYEALHARLLGIQPVISSAPTAGGEETKQASEPGSGRGGPEKAGCGRVIAIRDHFPHWAAHLESSDAGKLLSVRRLEHQASTQAQARGQPATARELCHQLFFDDNIEPSHAHIVDARWEDGSVIPFEHAINRYLWRAEPMRAILDRQYFVKSLAEAEANFSLDIAKLQSLQTLGLKPHVESGAELP